MLDKKEQRLLHSIEKAGVRASLRSGHLVSKEELLDLKIQIVPLIFRLISAAGGVAVSIASHLHFATDDFN